MEYKKLSSHLDRSNFFKNIAVKASQHCIKSFDSNELSEDEEKCLKKTALALHFIVERSRYEEYLLTNYPVHPY